MVAHQPEAQAESADVDPPALFGRTNQWSQGSASTKADRSRLGLLASGVFGLAGLVVMCIATPFVIPALRKHCLPYVPATDVQLANLRMALERHKEHVGSSFLDIGSGDGRVCRMAAKLGQLQQVHGVELNSVLVMYSRLSSISSKQTRTIRYYHKDLWKFPLRKYDSICIFGVESMMAPLEVYLANEATHRSPLESQTIFACRFPMPSLKPIEVFGHGIDTVWVYRLTPTK